MWTRPDLGYHLCDVCHRKPNIHHILLVAYLNEVKPHVASGHVVEISYRLILACPYPKHSAEEKGKSWKERKKGPSHKERRGEMDLKNTYKTFILLYQ